MPIETASLIKQLNVAYPPATDPVGDAAGHLRLLKAVLKSQFPNLEAPVTSTAEELSNPFRIEIGVVVMWGLPLSEIPNGWAFCDGRTVPRSDGKGNITTPDMTNLVPIGAGGHYTLGQTVGSAKVKATSSKAGKHKHAVTVKDGGKHAHGATVSGTVLTVDHLPPHDHYTVAAGINNDPLTKSTAIAEERTAGGDTEYRLMGAKSGIAATLGLTSKTGSGTAHAHGVTVDESSAHSHEATAEEAGEHDHTVEVSTIQPSAAINFIMKV